MNFFLGSAGFFQILLATLKRAEVDGAEFEEAGVVPVIEEAHGVADGVGAFAFNVVAQDPRGGPAVLRFCGAAVVAFNRDHNGGRMRG